MKVEINPAGPINDDWRMEESPFSYSSKFYIRDKIITVSAEEQERVFNIQYLQAYQQNAYQSWGQAFGQQLQQFQPGLPIPMSTPDMSHLGTVKEFRRKFKEYTKEEFRSMGKSPVVKEILSGMTKLNKEQIKDRIAEHLATV